MFENPGTKIKNLANAFFALEAIAAIIGGIVTMIIDDDMFWLGVVIAVAGIFAAYVTALFLAAFGELVESSEENRNINGAILDLMKKEKYQAPASVPAPASASEPVKRQIDYTEYYGVSAPKASKPVPGTWVCDNCNTQNSTNYSMCKKCGQYRRG